MLSVVGLLWNEALNAALKRHIAEPRPKGSFGRGTVVLHVFMYCRLPLIMPIPTSA